MPTLDLVRLKGNTNARIVMIHPSGGTFVGYRQDDFSIGGQAEYSNPFAAAMDAQNANLNAVAGEATAMMNRFGVDVELPMINLKTKEQTRHQWVSSQRPQVPVNIMLVRHSLSEPSVSQTASKLISLTFPRQEGGQALLDTPGGYNSGTAAGTWTVQIGRYFKADKLVLLNAVANFSKESVSDGSPLYVMLQCMFEPHMIVTESEFRAWFLS